MCPRVPDPLASRAEELYADLFARVPAADEGDVERLCTGHPELAQGLRELHRQKQAFHSVERDLFARAARDTEPAQKPVVAGFHLRQRLGSGGMGEVWEAEEIALRRTVALKLLAPSALGGDLDSARFRREAEAAGRVRHPNVVAVHAAGDHAGRHYIVQEIVPGGHTLRDELEQRRRAGELPNAWFSGVARTFLALADALATAHEAGVVHRDVKPQNILIASDGTPKLADFGLARLVGEASLSTTGDFVGTMLYASPEQVGRGELALDERTDVFSLGVTLYECLTLRRPFEGDSLHGVVQAITSYDPPPPRSVRPRVPLDLSLICMKAMEKRREDRYATMRDLREDLRRHLSDEPILARAPSLARRTQKWLRRHPTAATAIGLSAATFVLVIVLLLRSERLRRDALFSAQVSVQREGEARSSERRAMRVTEFVQDALIGSDPNQDGTQGYLVTEAMDDAVRDLEAGALRDDPETEASLAMVIATILNGNARPQVALRLAEQSLATRQGLYAGDHSDVAASLYGAAVSLESLGRNADALIRHEDALAMRQRVHPGDHSDVATSLTGVALCLDTLGRSAQALPLLEQALAMRRRLFQEEHPAVASSLNNLAYCLDSLGRSAEALPQYEAALELCRRRYAGDHPDTARALNNVAYCLNTLDRGAEALPKYEQARAMHQRLFQGDHPELATSLNNIAYCLDSMGRGEEALGRYEAALEMHQRLNPGDHPETATSLGNVAVCLSRLGRGAEALPRFEAALEMLQRLFPGDHPLVARGLSNVAGCLRALGRDADALGGFEASLAMRQRLFPGDHPDLALALHNLAAGLLSLGRGDEALTLAQSADEMAGRVHPAGHAARVAIAALLKKVRASLHDEP